MGKAAECKGRDVKPTRSLPCNCQARDVLTSDCSDPLNKSHKTLHKLRKTAQSHKLPDTREEQDLCPAVTGSFRNTKANTGLCPYLLWDSPSQITSSGLRRMRRVRSFQVPNLAANLITKQVARIQTPALSIHHPTSLLQSV